MANRRALQRDNSGRKQSEADSKFVRESRGRLAESLLRETRRSFAPAPGVTTKLVLAIGLATMYGLQLFGWSRKGKIARGSRWISKAAASAARYATQPRPTRRVQQCAIAGIAKSS